MLHKEQHKHCFLLRQWVKIRLFESHIEFLLYRITLLQSLSFSTLPSLLHHFFFFNLSWDCSCGHWGSYICPWREEAVGFWKLIFPYLLIATARQDFGSSSWVHRPFTARLALQSWDLIFFSPLPSTKNAGAFWSFVVDFCCFQFFF